MRKSVFIFSPIALSGVEFLRENNFDVRMYAKNHTITSKEIIDNIGDVAGIIPLLSHRIDKNIIDAAPNLKIIANYAVGYNNIDIAYAREKGIMVSNTPDVLTAATADLTWALILGVTKRINEAEHYLRKGKFKGWGPLLFLGGDVSGKKLGIIGAGNIGQAVGRRAAGFEMDIVYTAKSVKPEFEEETGAIRTELKTLLEESDIISIHCPLNEETHHLINRDSLKSIKKGAYLINTARGPIIDEDALVDSLLAGHLAGAGLDVFEQEPKVHDQLLKMDNVLLLPHIGSATIETREKMSLIAAKNIVRFFEKGQPLTPVY